MWVSLSCSLLLRAPAESLVCRIFFIIWVISVVLLTKSVGVWEWECSSAGLQIIMGTTSSAVSKSHLLHFALTRSFFFSHILANLEQRY